MPWPAAKIIGVLLLSHWVEFFQPDLNEVPYLLCSQVDVLNADLGMSAVKICSLKRCLAFRFSRYSYFDLSFCVISIFSISLKITHILKLFICLEIARISLFQFFFLFLLSYQLLNPFCLFLTFISCYYFIISFTLFFSLSITVSLTNSQSLSLSIAHPFLFLSSSLSLSLSLSLSPPFSLLFIDTQSNVS